ncbi:MAG: hypothetical protein SAL70_35695 [Scytonema sp. PMC 1070.18]|nr:hypothetical protein [Scytonema sp. PMC 1070.18]
MNFARYNLPFRPFRILIAAFACMILLFSNVTPASAIGNTRSDAYQGTAQLNKIQRKTDELTRSEIPSTREVQLESNKGLNEVQGDADIDKMKSPENSQNVTSVEDKVTNLFEKITGKK